MQVCYAQPQLGLCGGPGPPCRPAGSRHQHLQQADQTARVMMPHQAWSPCSEGLSCAPSPLVIGCTWRTMPDTRQSLRPLSTHRTCDAHIRQPVHVPLGVHACQLNITRPSPAPAAGAQRCSIGFELPDSGVLTSRPCYWQYAQGDH
jgi:hypothetical protein